MKPIQSAGAVIDPVVYNALLAHPLNPGKNFWPWCGGRWGGPRAPSNRSRFGTR